MEFSHHLRQFGFLALAIAVGLGVSYVSADWQLPGQDPPTGGAGYNTDKPVNTGPEAQLKEGPLAVAGRVIVSGDAVITEGKVGVNFGPADFRPISGDPIFCPIVEGEQTSCSTALDVNGQVRIRGGNPGPGKVLKAVDNLGLAEWALGSSVSNITSPDGSVIVATSTEATNLSVNFVANNPPGAVASQLRLSGNCVNNYSALRSIDGGTGEAHNGVIDPVDCQDFITQVTLLAGLTGGGTASSTEGNIPIGINAGDGLAINGSNQLTVRVNPAASYGIQLSGGELRLKNCDTTNPFLKYNGSTWECGSISGAVNNVAPGDSTLYQRVISALTPPACPGGWTRHPSSGYMVENIGHASNTNRSVACFNTNISCQVISFKNPVNTSLNVCPGDGAGPLIDWATAPGAQTCNGAACNVEYAPGGGQTNFVRNCYVCY